MSTGAQKKTPHFIVTAEGELLGEDSSTNRELARRIHACVNACEGITTEELERGIVKDMAQVMAQVIPLLKKNNVA